MDRHKGIAWLYEELPALVREGVLSSGASESLKKHYGEVSSKDRSSAALVIFSVVGAASIGLGIILLLAYNWNDLSRPLRAVIAIGLLLTAQGVGGYALLHRRTSVAWREGASTFLMLAAGASVALVSQTYQIQGDLGNFLFVWMVLSIPVIYLLDAVFPAVLYMVGITFWSGYEQEMEGHALWFWVLFGALVPHIVRAIRKDSASVRAIVLAWAVSLGLSVAIGITLERSLPGIWILVYSSYFAVLFLASARWFRGDARLAARPWTAVGAGGTAGLALILSFEWPWEEIGWNYYRSFRGYSELASVADYVLLAGLLAGAVFLLVTTERGSRETRIAFGVFPLVAAVGYGLSGFEMPALYAMLLFNVYVLGFAVTTMIRGIRTMSLGITNAGLAMLASLIIARFFDSGLGLVERGIAFIVIGSGFLAANLILMRRRMSA